MSRPLQGSAAIEGSCAPQAGPATSAKNRKDRRANCQGEIAEAAPCRVDSGEACGGTPHRGSPGTARKISGHSGSRRTSTTGRLRLAAARRCPAGNGADGKTRGRGPTDSRSDSQGARNGPRHWARPHASPAKACRVAIDLHEGSCPNPGSHPIQTRGRATSGRNSSRKAAGVAGISTASFFKSSACRLKASDSLRALSPRQPSVPWRAGSSRRTRRAPGVTSIRFSDSCAADSKADAASTAAPTRDPTGSQTAYCV